MVKLQKRQIKSLIHCENLEETSYQEILSLLRDSVVANNLPEDQMKLDPRWPLPIVYSKSRSKRPHSSKGKKQTCPICAGKSTPIIDIAKLRRGFTFLNLNLFPVQFPFEAKRWPIVPAGEAGTASAFGVHFLQWHSNEHDADLINQSPQDIAVNLKRLAALEHFCFTEKSPMATSHRRGRRAMRGYVGIIKNYGRLVGGSLEHGHMQLLHTNIEPLRMKQDLAFLKDHNCGYAEYLAKNTPVCLELMPKLKTIGVVVPPFAKRPLEATIFTKDHRKNYLFELDDKEIRELSLAIRSMSQAVVESMTDIGKEPAYNLVFHNGPIGGFYIEILPWTQQIGGYENWGLYLCQMTPERSAEIYQEKLEIK